MQQKAQLQNAQRYKTPNATQGTKSKKTLKFRKNDKNSKIVGEKNNFQILGVKRRIYYFRVRSGYDSFIVVIFF